MDQEEAKQKFQEAEKLRSEGRDAEALAILDALDQIFPNNKNILFARGLSLAQVGRDAEAKEIADKLGTVFNDPRATEIKAMISHRNERAQKDKGRSGKTEPGVSQTWIYGGVLILVLAAAGIGFLAGKKQTQSFQRIPLVGLVGVRIVAEVGAMLPPEAGGGGSPAAGSEDPTAPFHGGSFVFQGYDRGGSTETLEDAHLVYRFRIEVPCPILVEEITVAGSGDQAGKNSQIRVLDANRKILSTQMTTGFNELGTNTLIINRVIRDRLYLEEYDYSSVGHTVESIEITVSSARD